MQKCYIHIDSKDSCKELFEDERFVPIPIDASISSDDKSSEFVLLFVDYSPNESNIPKIFWKLISEGITSIIVLLKPTHKIESCWELLSKGFSDILVWENIESLNNFIESKYERRRLVKRVLDSNVVRENLIGNSKSWNRFLSNVIEASLFSNSNILISGESGTGKELVSRLVHTIDKRKSKGNLVLVDCTTLAPELAGSELFGHEKGSYTSSINSRDGAFALADQGTLFLDEISDLPLGLQAEILRAIQEKTYKRVGSNDWKKTNFRLICATNKNLKELVAEGRFRQDLYYRISDIQLSVPSLRQHSEDIEELASYFLNQFFKEVENECIPQFDSAVSEFIKNRELPGNVRELRQLVRRLAMHYCGGNRITIGCIPEDERPTKSSESSILKLIENWEESIKRAIVSGESLMNIKNIAAYLAIKIAIEMDQGDKQKAAERLNVSLRAVQQYIKKNPGVPFFPKDHDN